MLEGKKHVSRPLSLSCALTSLVMLLALWLWPAMASAEEPAFDARAVSTQTMYRLYNPNSGEHFYTANVGERDATVRAGWSYEGQGWVAPVRSKTPVYRLYSGTDHHYTTSAAERDSLVRAGWSSEGIGWYSDDARGIPLYRQFNPNVDPSAPTNNSGSHNYTISKSEHDFLCANGWNGEGIAWYGCKAGGGNTNNTNNKKPTSGGGGDIVYKQNVKEIDKGNLVSFNEATNTALLNDAKGIEVGSIIVFRPDRSKGDYRGGALKVASVDTSRSLAVVKGTTPTLDETFSSIHISESTTGIVGFAKDDHADYARSLSSSSRFSTEGFTVDLEITEEGMFSCTISDGYGSRLVQEFNPVANIVMDFDSGTFSKFLVACTSTSKVSADIADPFDPVYIPITPNDIVLETPIPGLYVTIGLKIKFSAEGSLDLAFTSSTTVGLSVDNGKVNPIHNQRFSADGTAHAELGADLVPTLGFGFIAWEAADLSLLIGPHCDFSLTHRSTSPYFTCAEGTAWLNLSLSLTDGDSVLCGILKDIGFGDVGWTFLGSGKNNPTRFTLFHMDNGKLVTRCTWKGSAEVGKLKRHQDGFVYIIAGKKEDLIYENAWIDGYYISGDYSNYFEGGDSFPSNPTGYGEGAYIVDFINANGSSLIKGDQDGVLTIPAQIEGYDVKLAFFHNSNLSLKKICFEENCPIRNFFISGASQMVETNQYRRGSLDELDLSNAKELTSLGFLDPTITEIDLSANTQLVDVYLNSFSYLVFGGSLENVYGLENLKQLNTIELQYNRISLERVLEIEKMLDSMRSEPYYNLRPQVDTSNLFPSQNGYEERS